VSSEKTPAELIKQNNLMLLELAKEPKT